MGVVLLLSLQPAMSDHGNENPKPTTGCIQHQGCDVSAHGCAHPQALMDVLGEIMGVSTDVSEQVRCILQRIRVALARRLLLHKKGPVCAAARDHYAVEVQIQSIPRFVLRKRSRLGSHQFGPTFVNTSFAAHWCLENALTTYVASRGRIVHPLLPRTSPECLAQTPSGTKKRACPGWPGRAAVPRLSLFASTRRPAMVVGTPAAGTAPHTLVVEQHVVRQ